MNMPGFTAEAALHKRSECYREKEEDIAVSRKGQGILPAARIDYMNPRQIRALCGSPSVPGIFLPPNPTKPGATDGTWGCLFPDGSGIICGGQTREEKNSCDTF